MERAKVVAIAGASSGVGKALAVRLAEQGYLVSLCARRENLVDEIAQSITRGGGKALGIRADMSNWKEAKSFIGRTAEKFGRVDVVVNNVGAGIRFADFDTLSVEEIDEGIGVNLMSVLYGCRAVLPIMIEQRSGHIINTTSILGKRARAGFSVYSAGKHGVEGFSRSLFNEVKKHGIKVSIIGPAVINTEWAAKAGIMKPMASSGLEPDDVAQVMQLVIETADSYSIWNMDLMAQDQIIDPL
jgi:NADP-dependent 3-hydroxy acid dehydrogenase YdfG